MFFLCVLSCRGWVEMVGPHGARRGGGPEGVGARRVGGPEEWGPEGWEGPKIFALFFFSLSRPIFALFVFLWVSSRGILVFEAPGESNVHVWALGLSQTPKDLKT